MTSASFPSDPNRRKAIIVLKQHDFERCVYESEAAEALFDDEVVILQTPIQLNQQASRALKNISAAGLARPGMILIQSPFDLDVYEDVEHAPQRFALAKYMHFSHLCRQLGAKSVEVEQVSLTSRAGKISVKVNAESRYAEADTSVEKEDLEELRSQMSISDIFAGGEADIDAAQDLLEKTGLYADPTMRALVDMRRGAENRLLSRTLKLNLSSESRQNFHVVGRLKIPSFVDISGDYNRICLERHEYSATLRVEFSEAKKAGQH